MLTDGGYDPAWRAWAWAAFAVAMITDIFDGHLARTYNLVTDFGKIADPIADKAIMGAALICLSALGDLPWWVTGVILFRELGITLMRFWVIRHGVIPASRGGKMKTLAQGMAVGMYVLALTGPLATLRWWVMAVAVVLTVVTGLDYVRQAIVLRRQGARRRAPRPRREARAERSTIDVTRPRCCALLAERGETLAVARVADRRSGGRGADLRPRGLPGLPRLGDRVRHRPQARAAGGRRRPAGRARSGGPGGRGADGGRRAQGAGRRLGHRDHRCRRVPSPRTDSPSGRSSSPSPGPGRHRGKWRRCG